MEMALNLLLECGIIVFFVLVLLIVIIKIYSAIVQAAQSGVKNRKEAKQTEKKEAEPTEAVPQISTVSADDGTIPGEVIAVIAAAVDAVYGDKPVKIKSVKRSRSNSGSAWRNAGLFENTKPF